MTDQELDAEYDALKQEHQQLEAEHKELEARGPRDPHHPEHARRLRAHIQRLHAYMRARGYKGPSGP